MATERAAMTPEGLVIFLDENKDAMLPSGSVISEQNIAAAPTGGRIMGSLANYGGLAGQGGIAGRSGGLAG